MLTGFPGGLQHEMGNLMMARHPVAPGDEDGARRYQRTVARTLWAALPVPFNRWRPRALPKVERNDPCHCGSGRKFKQCCAEFVGTVPPIEPDGFYTMALAQAEPAMLTPDQVRLVPGEALGMTAMDWNERGQSERTAAVLAPLFLQRDDLDGRHEMAFDALMDAMQAQSQETQRRALARHISHSQDKRLATAARCRQATMLADQGDWNEAWAMFQSAQRLNPGEAQLLHLESADPEKDISIYINSPGGSIYAGLAIYDTMQFIKPQVSTICCGIAMSMGSLLLAGGAEGKRMALPNSRILIHQPSSPGYEGQATDIEIHAREILKTRARIDEIYAKHCKKPVEEVHHDMERDRFFSSAQAVEYGLIDRVLTTH